MNAMKLFRAVAFFAALLALNSASSTSAGFLYSIGGPSNSAGNISLVSSPSLQFQSLLMPIAPAFQADLTINAGWPVQDGTAHLVGGLYSDVQPLIGFIAITDGSQLEFAPGVLSSNLSYGAGGQFSAVRHMGYLPGWAVIPGAGPDGPLFFSSQFKGTGYLTEGATVSIASTAYIKVGIHQIARLAGARTWSTAGEFSIDYSEFMEVSGFNLNVPGSFELEYRLSVNINAPAGAGTSWVTLDPGVGAGSDPDNLFPWLPAPNPVPEPASWLLGLIGMAAVPWLRRRTAPHSA